MYRIEYHCYSDSTSSSSAIRLNEVSVAQVNQSIAGSFHRNSWTGPLKRLDRINIDGEWGGGGLNYERFTITKV